MSCFREQYENNLEDWCSLPNGPRMRSWESTDILLVIHVLHTRPTMPTVDTKFRNTSASYQIMSSNFMLPRYTRTRKLPTKHQPIHWVEHPVPSTHSHFDEIITWEAFRDRLTVFSIFVRTWTRMYGAYYATLNLVVKHQGMLYDDLLHQQDRFFCVHRWKSTFLQPKSLGAEVIFSLICTLDYVNWIAVCSGLLCRQTKEDWFEDNSEA